MTHRIRAFCAAPIAGNTIISIDRDAGGGTYPQSDLVVIIGQVIAEDDLTFLTNNLII